VIQARFSLHAVVFDESPLSLDGGEGRFEAMAAIVSPQGIVEGQCQVQRVSCAGVPVPLQLAPVEACLAGPLSDISVSVRFRDVGTQAWPSPPVYSRTFNAESLLNCGKVTISQANLTWSSEHFATSLRLIGRLDLAGAYVELENGEDPTYVVTSFGGAMTENEAGALVSAHLTGLPLAVSEVKAEEASLAEGASRFRVRTFPIE